MDKKPAVSILISSYNSANTIGACLNACINQSFTDIEIIVVDYGSIDDSVAIVSNYISMDKRVRLIRRQPHVFYFSAARECARSPYVLILSPNVIVQENLISDLLNEDSSQDYPNDRQGLTLFEIDSDQYCSQGLDHVQISCITPVYNGSDYLPECLNSIICQSLSGVESLCVDDGSTDDTLSIIESFAFRDARVRFAENCHQGAGKSRNLAIHNAKGEYISFLDSDDCIPENDIYELMYRTARSEKVLVCGGCFSDYDGEHLRTEFNGVLSGYVFKESARIQYSDYQFDFGFDRFIYSKDLLIENDLMFPDRSYYEDPVWFVRVMEEAGEFYAIDRVTYRYRYNHKPFSPAVFSEKNVADLSKGATEILEIAKRNGWNKLIALTCQRYLNDYAPFVYPRVSAENANVIDSIEDFGRLSGSCGAMAMYRLSQRYLDEFRRDNEDALARIQDKNEQLQDELASKGILLSDNAQHISDLCEQIKIKDDECAALAECINRLEAEKDVLHRDFALLKRRFDQQPHIRVRNGIRYIRSRHKNRNRIVIQLRDRLGNQMFIYALYLKLKSLGRTVSIDDSSMIAETEIGRIFNSRELNETFGIDYDRASDSEIEALKDTGNHKSDRVRRKIFGNRSIIYSESKDFAFDEALLRHSRGYYEGYFQNSEYFEGVESEIRNAFRFRNIPDSNQLALDMEKRIRASHRSVSIHLRFGDYLTSINSQLYGGICTDLYYAACINMVKQQSSEALTFFIFSDEPERAAKWLQIHKALFCESDSITVVDVCSGSKESWIDMYLMSLCKYNIIANSSYSFWASYLNDRNDKAVFGPLYWLRRGGELIKGVHTESMVLVDPEGQLQSASLLKSS